MGVDPFCIAGPAILSVSGGRTSAYMLKRVIDAHGGALPADVHPVFADTGKERPETYAFIRECSERWGVRIERVQMEAPEGVIPFEHLIRTKRYLPNNHRRICTQFLKVEPIHAFARSLGWESWTSVIGMRADEPLRVARGKANAEEFESKAFPLHAAGVTKSDVLAWWRAQPFDLQLQPHESNCDLCFLKGAGIRAHIIEKHPELTAWWVEMERVVGGRFNDRGPTYERLADFVARQGRLPFDTGDTVTECACTD